MGDIIKLTDLEKDALKESANIGAGNAAAKLSQETNKKVNLVVSDLNFVSMGNLDKLIGGPKKLIVGIYTPVKGDLSGTIIVVFPIESALDLSHALQRKKGESPTSLGPNDLGALKKMGNILSDSYLESLAQFLEMKIKREESKVVSTFGESIVDLIMLQLDSESDNGLLIQTDFNVEDTNISGRFILLLTIKNVENVLNKIKQKLG